MSRSFNRVVLRAGGRGLAMLSLTGIVRADIVTTGNTIPVINSPANFSTPRGVEVGPTSTGTLTVTGSSTLDSAFGRLGEQVGGNGSAAINDNGDWNMTGGLSIGVYGRGELTVSSGGAVTAGFMTLGTRHIGVMTINSNSTVASMASADLGFEPTGNGTVNVIGAGAAWDIGTFFIVGNAGQGALTISNIGKVTSDNASVGSQASGTGSVKVQSGGLWELDSFLLIGNEGTAALEITSGGQVTSGTFGRLGASLDSDGSVTITGAGSKWSIATTLEIGRDGQGVMLVEQGGEVSTGDVLAMGSIATGHGELTVTGVGSKVTSLAQISVGHEANSELTVSAGALLDSRKAASATNSSSLVGRAVGVTGVATITGPGTQWIQDGTANIGFRGIGTMHVQNGAVVHTVDGVIARFNTATGTANVTGAGAQWQVDNNLDAGGSPEGVGGGAALNVSAGGQVEVGNTLRVWAGGAVNLAAGGEIDAAAIRHNEGGAFNFTGGMLRVDTFTGNLVNAGGTLAPGASAGLTTINGNYTQRSGATLEIELGGTAPGEFDRVEVGGTAMLHGILNVSLINSFTPALGNSFGILFASGGFGGTFDAILLPALPGGLGWQLNPGGATLFLNVVTASADFDFNGVVNGADLTKWKAGFGMGPGATHMQGDTDGDQDVDGADFLVWQRQLGSAATVAVTAAVPEPSTWMLLWLSTVAAKLASRRRIAELVSTTQ